ncbi:MAG: hypothetical protein JRC92_08945 [Deltaproteobacteria bacterium]|nr:hypothetical protein [Deltaproteobacteria bacterium]
MGLVVRMCFQRLARIITAGAPKVFYLAQDTQGGMVHLFENLPPVWKKIAFQVFVYSGRLIDQKIEKN